MSFIGDVVREALQILSQFGAELREVLWLTLVVSLIARQLDQPVRSKVAATWLLRLDGTFLGPDCVLLDGEVLDGHVVGFVE